MYDIRTLYIFEHDQILVELHDWERTQHLTVYDSKIDTFNIQDIENGSWLKNPKVYIESLISP